MTSNDPSLVFRKIYNLTLQQQLLKVQKFEKDLIICPVSTTLFFSFKSLFQFLISECFAKGNLLRLPFFF